MKGFIRVFTVLLLLQGAAFAEENTGTDKTYILEETAVSATRSEVPVEKAPANVTVITSEEIQSKNASTLDEYLRNEAGVVVGRNKGLAASTLSISMRGLATGDRNLVLLDGVPINDGYTGAVSWTQLGIENVERIEITRGPGSALYGGNALGGVMNIVTKKPGKPEGKIKAGLGSENTRKMSGYFSGMLTDNFGIRIGGEYEKNDGYVTSLLTRTTTTRPGTGLSPVSGGRSNTTRTGAQNYVIGDAGKNWGERQNINLQTFLIPDDSSMLVLGAQWGKHGYGYSAPSSYLRDENGRTVTSGYIDLGSGQYVNVNPANFVSGGMGEETYLNLALSYDKELSFMDLATKLSYNTRNKWYTTPSTTGFSAATYDNAPGNKSDADIDSWYYEVQGTKALGRNKLTGGMTFKSNSYDASEYSLSFYRDENSETAKTTNTEGKDRYIGFFLHDELTLPAGFTLFGGLRYDTWKAYDGKSGNVGSEQTHEEPSDSAWSPKVALVWNYYENTAIRLSYGTGFRAPTIYELYRTWVSTTGVNYHSNPDLDPEKFTNYEIGFDQFFFDKKLKITGAYYYSELKDAIERVSTGQDRYFDNVGKVRIQGFELSTEIVPVRNLTLWANASWVESEIRENKSNPALEGKQLTDVPKVVYNIGGSYKWRMLKFAVDGNYRGRTYYDSDNEDQEDVYTGYSKRWLWNAKTTVDFNEHLSLSGSVNNIFDEDYYDYYVGQGRTYKIELAGKF